MKKHMMPVWMFWLAAMLPAAARANDSSAMLGAGGIVLVANDMVRLESEDLFISPSEIRIRYEFLNEGTEDFTTEVAFPLPDIDLAMLSETGIATPTDDPVNFVGFSVQVDGRPVEFSGEMRAFAGDKDVTALLVAQAIPVSRFVEGFYETLQQADEDARKVLSDAGVVFWDDFGNVYPKWTMRTIYHWQQLFPVGKKVVVEHRYKPVLGLSFFSGYDLEALHAAPEAEEDMGWSIGKAYCMTPQQEEVVKSMLEHLQGQDYPVLSSAVLQYILTTANNWSGPIGRFRMEVALDRPKQVMATCMKGLVEETPGKLVFSARGFVPEHEVDLLFLNALSE
ncbi:MAG TPA: hypothetical protein DCW68_05535 [Rhodospirillaceae bacterium]|nr:MAG: hypothetical protein A2018_02120 [Alphaproteobacteria bacterium GWF2_58_20]HAU29557.1 hypothetical protein [Rhodospirillaceae bacterium]